MATINEMAEKASENYLGEAFEQGIFADGYIAGANYVLEEIEKLVKFNRWAARDLYELIEQLKK